MKFTTRSVAVLATIALLAVPVLASAATQVYSDSSGNFQYSNPNFSISFGNANAFLCGPSSICKIATTILFVINSVLVPVLFAVAFIVFLYGIVLKYIFSHGDPAKVSEGHKILLWGLLAFVIMISLWGLVNVVANTFGLGGYAAPAIPRSY